MRRLSAQLIGTLSLVAFIAGCSMLREDIKDAERRYLNNEERYQSVADAVLAGDGVPDQEDGLYKSWDDLAGEGEIRFVRFSLESYGMATSGRQTGLAFYQSGSPLDEGGGHQRTFETCKAAALWLESENHSLQVAYCHVSGNWWAYQISN